MWEFFIRHSKFAYLFLVALVLLGGFSVITIPKESSPEVVIPVGVVGVAYPGAAAADVESLVTNELERGLANLEDVKKITSTSREGFASVVVEFEADADLDGSIQDLKDEVDIIKPDLPEDAEEPTVSEVDYINQPILTIALAAPLSDRAFTELTDALEVQLENVSGVSHVEWHGVREREVNVIVNQAALTQYDLTLNEIIGALRNANVTFPVGQIINDGIAYNVVFEGDITNTSEIANLPIVARGGQPVYVRDIATVEDGLAAANSFSRLSVAGAPSVQSVSVDVYKQSGGDITKITAAVNNRVEELKAPGELLADAETFTVLDAGADINKDLVRLTVSGFQTVTLVVLLLVFTIGWREGLLAGAAIPLSFLFGFIGLYASGNTINFLSLFSLILGIGILVDSAIVIVEGINRKMKSDTKIDKKEAAIAVIHEFAAPLISGTLTTVSMFAGLFIVSGVIGQFISSIPFTLIFLLFASLFVALAILPLLAAGFLHRRNTSKLEEKQVQYARRLEDWYRRHLTPFVFDIHKQERFLALIAAGLVFAISFTFNVWGGLITAPLIYALSLKTLAIQQRRNWSNWKRALLWYPTALITIIVGFTVTGKIFPTYNPIAVTFFEQSDVDYVIAELEYPEGTTKELTDLGIRRVEELLYEVSDIESFTTTVGSGNQFGSGGTGEKFANIFINLSTDRDRTSTEVVEALRQKAAVLQDLHVTFSQPSDGPPTGAAIIVKFLGDDLAALTTLANESANIFRSLPNTTNIETSTTNNSTEFVLTLDKAKTAALGLDPFTVSQLARTAVYGTKATALTSLDDDIDVVVKLNVGNVSNVQSDKTNIINVDTLEQIAIPIENGTVPLSSLVTTSLRESNSVISHEEAKRVVTVTADVTASGNVRETQALALERIKSELQIPDDVLISTGGGETDESNTAFIEMFLALIVGVLLMVGILVLQFNSYLHMRYVLSILPYSLIGIMAGLALTANPLSFPSIMGFIALSGIVVNNSILLIDMMNSLRREQPKRDVHEIVLEAASSRLRPILLTTITTVIGMVPLTYAGDLWAPLAYAVMFGLVFSVLITLVLIPILYTRRPGTLDE